ncbi:MAG: prepilin-type N-terminal cleavage/methylation domain-containing protein, partial [Bdellovibrionales bacterium]|nr:prepilin-type N-terminal cleavage/methylation domain-containing protein [Bdellovibrionales bacterium]
MLHVSRVFSKEARKKSLGFSLIEITVGLGVVSILALGSANMIVDVVKTQKTSESNVSVMRARKEFLFELKHWKKNKVPANIPVRLNAQMETSFTEAGVRSVEGVNIVVKVGGQLLKEGSIYTLGNTKFEVTKLTFSEAEKVYNDGTNTSYFGSIKMSTKNLTTGL